MDIALGKPQENLGKTLRKIDEASKDSPDIICLPELFTTGYYLEEANDLAEPIPGATTEALSKKAKTINSFIIAGSILEKSSNGIYNTSVVINLEGKTVGKYSKIHLFPLFNEDKYLKAGNESFCLDLGIAKIGIMICYDLRFPELARKLALQDGEILFIPSEFPNPRLSHWRHLLIARAIENQLFVVGVNRVGEDEKTSYFGHSMIVNPMGEVLVEADENEKIIYAEINLDEIKRVRSSLPTLTERRPETY